MGQPLATQHPAVVLRSHFKLVRNLLAVAMAALVALSAVVVILATDDDAVTGRIAQPAELAPPNPAVHSHPRAAAPGTRYDGGPDEGTRATASSQPAPVPERTTDSGGESSRGPIVIPQGPGGPR